MKRIYYFLFSLLFACTARQKDTVSEIDMTATAKAADTISVKLLSQDSSQINPTTKNKFDGIARILLLKNAGCIVGDAYHFTFEGFNTSESFMFDPIQENDVAFDSEAGNEIMEKSNDDKLNDLKNQLYQATVTYEISDYYEQTTDGKSKVTGIKDTSWILVDLKKISGVPNTFWSKVPDLPFKSGSVAVDNSQYEETDKNRIRLPMSL
ncbi:MAG: hypothetical protein H7Y04_01320, partial [Verrucomicrobia bacterium]|nr:hypothetical protein [Cytophagales bacterium]